MDRAAGPARNLLSGTGGQPPAPCAIESRAGGVHAVRFQAMGSPCEILVHGGQTALVRACAQACAAEALRIEAKFSRYRSDSVVQAINASAGRPVAIDAETARLLDYAAHCHRMSGGRFDITSGVLRRAWTFDASARVPAQADIEALLPLIGFERLERTADHIVVPPGMQIDLGGIAKEYAVDSALERAQQAAHASGAAQVALLVNFGGDLRANRPPPAQAWQVAVEDPARGSAPALVLELSRGALATSGDAHRYVERDGVRYSHILDPRTGWPVPQAPRSITVAAPTCVQAGTLSTIALLMGRDAEAFLDGFALRYWCLRASAVS